MLVKIGDKLRVKVVPPEPLLQRNEPVWVPYMDMTVGLEGVVKAIAVADSGLLHYLLAFEDIDDFWWYRGEWLQIDPPFTEKELLQETLEKLVGLLAPHSHSPDVDEALDKAIFLLHLSKNGRTGNRQ